MARIRSRDTAPEVLLRRVLRQHGLRPTYHPKLPGSPDMGFVRRKVAVFLDGCFWHGCPQHYVAPRTRQLFWRRKLADNVDRDGKADTLLHANGFRVVHVWQHELNDADRVAERVAGELAPDKEGPSTPGFSEGRVWWACWCGSTDVLVAAVSGPGSLKPGGKERPEAAALRCRACAREWTRAVPKVMS
jgi:DNA mismatch endonuclease (patch repair protein)